jgi:hypothetical protein
MPVIRIDDEVWKFLQESARPFVDSPNDVLRRLLGLSEGSSSQVQKEHARQIEEGGSAMRNIRPAALKWFIQQLSNPNSPIAKHISKYGGGFDKRYMRASKYFPAAHSYPGIPVWWLQIPLEWVRNPDDRPAFVWLVCQKEPNNLSDFWCLAVPIEYLNSQYSNGNLAKLGDNICLHLSTQKCTYRGYEVGMFDDIRLTWLTKHRPTSFGQFRIDEKNQHVGCDPMTMRVLTIEMPGKILPVGWHEIQESWGNVRKGDAISGDDCLNQFLGKS